VLIFGNLLFLSQRLPIYQRSPSNAGYTVLLEEVAEELRQTNAVETEKKLCIPRNKTLDYRVLSFLCPRKCFLSADWFMKPA